MKNMKLFTMIFTLITLLAFPVANSQALSFADLKNNPDRYLSLPGKTRNIYLQSNSIAIVRYEPPYYILDTNVIACDFEYNKILVMSIRFSYDYTRSNQGIIKLIPKSAYPKVHNPEQALDLIKDVGEFIEEEKRKDSGISFLCSSAALYDLDGNFISSTSPTDQFFQPCKYNSRYYWVGALAFYKIYNLRF